MNQIQPHQQTELKSYEHTYIPEYTDPYAVEQAIIELKKTDGITSPEMINFLREEMGRIAVGECLDPIIITGNCARSIDASEPIETIISEIEAQRNIVRDIFQGNALYISRVPNQNYKPRSSQYEITEEGRSVPSYYGDGVNGYRIDQRTPDPTRMVSGALQARDIVANMPGDLLISAHEALVPMYERNFVHYTGSKKAYLLSGELPWIGNRTRRIDSPQVEFLSKVENPIGIKIDGNVTEKDVAALYTKLNPESAPGKLAFTLRVGASKLDRLQPLLKAIALNAPNSIVMSDPMHGNTVTQPNGKKTRIMKDMTREIIAVKSACELAGLRLHGIHLETTGRDDSRECVTKLSDKRDEPVVDPQLNNAQLRQLLKVFRSVM